MAITKGIRIVNKNGVSMGTEVIDVHTGKLIPMVRSVKIDIPLGDVITANVECILPTLDIVVADTNYKIVGYKEMMRQERAKFNKFLDNICWKIWKFIS